MICSRFHEEYWGAAPEPPRAKPTAQKQIRFFPENQRPEKRNRLEKKYNRYPKTALKNAFCSLQRVGSGLHIFFGEPTAQKADSLLFILTDGPSADGLGAAPQ